MEEPLDPQWPPPPPELEGRARFMMMLRRFGFWIVSVVAVAVLVLLYLNAELIPQQFEISSPVAGQQQETAEETPRRTVQALSVPAEAPDTTIAGVPFSITTEPAGASIFVDGAYVGASPLQDVVLAEGRRLISVMKRDYAQLDTFVTADETLALLELTLRETDDVTLAATDTEPLPETLAASNEEERDEPFPATSDEQPASSSLDTAPVDQQQTPPARDADDPSTEADSAPTPQPSIEQADATPPVQPEDTPVTETEETPATDIIEEPATQAIPQPTASNDAQEVAREQARLAEARRADSLAALARRNEQQYQYLAGQADALFGQGNFEEALAKYKEMLRFRPNDPHATAQIAACQSTLDEQRAQQNLLDAMVEDGVYLISDEPPELIGGLDRLHRKIRYPQRASDAGVEGRVYVAFVVDEKGRVQNPKIVQSLGYGCDEEVLRVIQTARFKPGTVGGQSVKVRHTLYVDFKLSE